MSDVEKVVDNPPSFMFRRLAFAEGVLTIVVGDYAQDHAEITFEHVRTFAFFKESDFFREFGKYDHVQLVRGNERTLGVYCLTRGSILEGVLDNRLDSENPQYFWVSTPDECLEVVGFSAPLIKSLQEKLGPHSSQ